MNAEQALNAIIEDLENIQERIAVYSDELDSDILEEAEGAIDVAIERIQDVMEEHGW